MIRSLPKFALSAAALTLLSGCVAAVIPLAAGGALLRGEGKNPDVAVAQNDIANASDVMKTSVPASSGNAEPTQLATVVDQIESAPPSGNAVDIEPINPLFRAPTVNDPVLRKNVAIEQAVAEAPLSSAEPVAAMAKTETSSELAAISGRALSTAIFPTSPADYRAYDVLYNYVELQSRRDPVDNPRQSALLAAPGTLSPTRTDCSIRPPAVLIDLDPGEEVFDPATTPSPNPALGQMLLSLRLQEVDIMWISRLAAVEAGDVRKALVESGLDPQGRDQLLLMRNADDRKQGRRRELSETHCLLAIAGDNRADFDELYLYLKDQDAAQPLEELIGSGWFLIPPPLTPQSSIAQTPTERPNP